MNRYKSFFLVFVAVLTASAAFGQENPKINQVLTISGTVADIDVVGSTISILTADQHQLSLYVPANAKIIRDTQDIGLMDIKEGHPVTIQYDISSPGKDIVESIIDNKPEEHE